MNNKITYCWWFKWFALGLDGCCACAAWPDVDSGRNYGGFIGGGELSACSCSPQRNLSVQRYCGLSAWSRYFFYIPTHLSLVRKCQIELSFSNVCMNLKCNLAHYNVVLLGLGVVTTTSDYSCHVRGCRLQLYSQAKSSPCLFDQIYSQP